jgi:thiol-disulfide isomerase/thioredoxin
MRKILEVLKPWAGAMLVVAALHYTGLLSGISFFAQSAILETGLMNAQARADKDAPSFDYDFKIKDLDGNRVDFNKFRNKVVFINLWATWCGPCRVEMPTIQKLFEKTADHPDIVFVMLSIDRDKDQGKVVKYIRDKDFSFPVFMPSGYLSSQLNVPNIPTTFVISKEGQVILKEVGTTNFDTKRFKKFLETEANK